MNLTLNEAYCGIEAAILKAKELKIRIGVAICDSGGRLISFSRMDGTYWATVYGSQGKAMAAAGFGRSTGSMQPDSTIVQGVIKADGNNMIPAQGGLPIIRDEMLVGACGVAGGTGDQGEECAQAAIDAIIGLAKPADQR